jgi:membrane fusion protein (multidrug efflux system)
MMKRLLFIVTALFVMVILAASTACLPGKGEGSKEEVGTKAAPGSETGTKLLVSVKKLAYEKFEHFFLANGTVEAVNDAFISPEINGRIKTIHVREGQRVEKGQLLVSLNSEVTESSLAEVNSALQLASIVYERRRDLWDKKIGSEIQFLEAKTNKESLENRLKSLEAQLKMANIKAPISGIVDKIYQKEGELAVPGLQLIQLVNLKTVYVNADVSESYIAKIKKGDPVEVSFPSYPGYTLEGHIHRIGQVVKSQNRTFLVQVLLDNADEKLKPNMVAVLKIRDFSAEAALVVPSIIIKNDLQGSYLYVVEEEEGQRKARKTYVTPGISQGSHTMVTTGLEPGWQVIIQGYNLVKSGSDVKVEKMENGENK